MIRRAAIALLVSAALHGATLAAGLLLFQDFDPNISFSLPESVEFGVVDDVTGWMPEAIVDDPPSDAPATPVPSSGHHDQDLAAAQAEARRAAREAARRARAEARRERARRAQAEQATSEPVTAGTLPAGAQLALRINLSAIRGHPLEEDIRRLLAQVPDWRLVLEGSGIDPVRDLERVMIASPNMRRARVVIAGRHRLPPEFAEQAVARLAAAKDAPAPWEQLGPFPMAPWHNRDATARVVVVLNPQAFLIARREDVPRVLASALARGHRPSNPEQALLDGLLFMPEGAAMTLTVEGAQHYVRFAHPPRRLEVVVQAAPNDPSAQATLTANFEDGDGSIAAEAAFRDMVTRAAANPLLALMGIAPLLNTIRFEREDAELVAHAHASPRQMRLVLGWVRSKFEAYARQRGDWPSAAGGSRPVLAEPEGTEPEGTEPEGTEPEATGETVAPGATGETVAPEAVAPAAVSPGASRAPPPRETQTGRPN